MTQLLRPSEQEAGWPWGLESLPFGGGSRALGVTSVLRAASAGGMGGASRELTTLGELLQHRSSSGDPPVGEEQGLMPGTRESIRSLS